MGHARTFVTEDGASIYYEIHGDGPPLTLIMGLDGNHALWDPELIDLKK